MAIPGKEGCETWLAAESDLIAKADIVPFANNVVRTFGAGAKFEITGPADPDQHPDAGVAEHWTVTASSVAPATTAAPAAPVSLADPWVRFGVRRLGRLLVSLWVLVTASFAMIHLIPGDPVRGALGPTAPARPGRGAPSRAGARRPDPHPVPPLPEGPVHRRPRHVALLAAAGLRRRRPAAARHALPGRARFLVAVVVVAIPLGVAMGVLTRRGHGRRTELAFTTTSIVVATIPDFLIGVGLVYVFGVRLGWLPVAGNDTPVGVRAAGDLAGDRARRDPVPHRPGRDGRRARGRLRAYGAGQAPARPDDLPRPRLPERPHRRR